MLLKTFSYMFWLISVCMLGIYQTAVTVAGMYKTLTTGQATC